MKRIIAFCALAGMMLAAGEVVAQHGVKDKERDGKFRNPPGQAPQAKPAQPAAGQHRPQPAPQAKPQPKPQPPKPAPQVKPQPRPLPPKPAPQVKPQPKPLPPKPAPQVKPQPKPLPPKPPAPEYRPGHKKYALRKPQYVPDHYRGWLSIQRRHRYPLTETFSQSRVLLPVGSDIEFELEEDSANGYRWFARFDPQLVDVDIDHHRPDRRHFWSIGRPVGVPGYAEIEIEARHYLGGTMVELVYARPDEWERGIAPRRVIEVYVEIVR